MAQLESLLMELRENKSSPAIAWSTIPPEPPCVHPSVLGEKNKNLATPCLIGNPGRDIDGSPIIT